MAAEWLERSLAGSTTKRQSLRMRETSFCPTALKNSPPEAVKVTGKAYPTESYPLSSALIMTLKFSILALAVASAPTLATQAAVFTFDLGGGGGTSSYTSTAGGITLTVSDPNNSGGTFTQSGSGTYLSGEGEPFPSSWKMSFDQEVTLVAYNVGLLFGPDTFNTMGTLSVTTAGHSSVGNDVTTEGSDLPFNTPFTLAANEVATLQSFFTGDTFGGLIVLQSITVSTVPEPEAAAAVGSGLCGAAALLLRRRRAA